ncbi:hypothetical protein K437DRAFT_275788 [Tilletiaria anomala UBC 951]|uniref:Uncharacterized protein n=1 Tax=Tilletiaria anomala (strain ATCC 24038 / CBS 436.72 / UBC 951) TaxID=1037660 RepID=A0A066VIN1_TILAU|nr:uncharacterized protein K437DRAFT_275788 [Tilletiaria anomala UBC 951]KDN40168.1 hypothetical protein K437DRAFT_275788 [Tilletiaria anomala UBC 951]
MDSLDLSSRTAENVSDRSSMTLPVQHSLRIGVGVAGGGGSAASSSTTLVSNGSLLSGSSLSIHVSAVERILAAEARPRNAEDDEESAVVHYDVADASNVLPRRGDGRHINCVLSPTASYAYPLASASGSVSRSRSISPISSGAASPPWYASELALTRDAQVDSHLPTFTGADGSTVTRDTSLQSSEGSRHQIRKRHSDIQRIKALLTNMQADGEPAPPSTLEHRVILPRQRPRRRSRAPHLSRELRGHETPPETTSRAGVFASPPEALASLSHARRRHSSLEGNPSTSSSNKQTDVMSGTSSTARPPNETLVSDHVSWPSSSSSSSSSVLEDSTRTRGGEMLQSLHQHPPYRFGGSTTGKPQDQEPDIEQGSLSIRRKVQPRARPQIGDIEDAHELPLCPDDCRCSDAEQESGLYRCAMRSSPEGSSGQEEEGTNRSLHGLHNTRSTLVHPSSLSSLRGQRDLARFPAVRPRADDEVSSGSLASVHTRQELRVEQTAGQLNTSFVSAPICSTRPSPIRSHSSPIKHSPFGSLADVNIDRACNTSSPPAESQHSMRLATNATTAIISPFASTSKRSITDFFERVMRDEQEKRAQKNTERVRLAPSVAERRDEVQLRPRSSKGTLQAIASDSIPTEFLRATDTASSSLLFEAEGRDGSEKLGGQKLSAYVGSPESNAKWKSFGRASGASSLPYSTQSPSLSHTPPRNAHQMANRGPNEIGILNASLPTAGPDAVQEQIERALGGSRSPHLELPIALGSDRAVLGDEEPGIGLNAYQTPGSRGSSLMRRRSGRLVRFSPKLEYHSPTGSESTDLASPQADDNSFSREMRSLHDALEDLSKSHSSHSPVSDHFLPLPPLAEPQPPNMDLSVLYATEVHVAANSAATPHNESLASNLTPQPPGYYKSPSKSSSRFSRHILLRPKKREAPASEPGRAYLESGSRVDGNDDDRSNDSSDPSNGAGRIALTVPRASTPPLASPAAQSPLFSHLSGIEPTFFSADADAKVPDSIPKTDTVDKKRSTSIRQTIQQLDQALEALKSVHVRKIEIPVPMHRTEDSHASSQPLFRQSSHVQDDQGKMAKSMDDWSEDEKQAGSIARLERARTQLQLQLSAKALVHAQRKSDSHVSMISAARRVARKVVGLLFALWFLLWIIDCRVQILFQSLHSSPIVPSMYNGGHRFSFAPIWFIDTGTAWQREHDEWQALARESSSIVEMAALIFKTRSWRLLHLTARSTSLGGDEAFAGVLSDTHSLPRAFI